MDTWVPIACSLQGGDARRRSQEWNALVGQHLEVQRSDQKLTIRFAANAIPRAELARLVVAERQCCGFVTWELHDQGEEMLLTVSGDPFGVTAMAKAFRLEN
ncbi:MAG TPA: hypothetical protein VJ796_08115 [Acidimicrobiia bacterium]|jgi:hypothetical protein|nr:hypothetical protein [Acidimicrobiia bacterium]